MDKEEKEVKKVTKKTTATKKSTAKKTDTTKKTTKITTKKTTPSKSKSTEVKTKTVKKPDEKAQVKKPTVKSVEPIKKEEKVEKIVEIPLEDTVKEQKVVTSTANTKKVSNELLEIRKKRYIIEAIIIAVLVIIALLFLCNRTFLKTSYKTDNISVDIPRFSYYVKDKDSKVKLFTLRKSDYLKDYYNEYLEGFTFYSCAEGNNTFYYNEETTTLIKEIKVEKKFAVKTIEITYDTRTPEEVCGLR